MTYLRHIMMLYAFTNLFCRFCVRSHVFISLRLRVYSGFSPFYRKRKTIHNDHRISIHLKLSQHVC